MNEARSPHTKATPCPVCNGHRDLPRGKGVRCHGYTVTFENRQYAFCSREEHAGRLLIDRDSGLYPHRLDGECKCGVTHGASVHRIGAAATKIVATYDYTDAMGALLYQVVRFEPKDFRQRRPDGRGGWIWNLGDVKPVLYRLPEVIDAVAAGDTVYIVEGEKDVESLRRLHLVATCNSGGAGKWPSGCNGYLAGATVVVIADKDDGGYRHADGVREQLLPYAKALREVEPRRGKDVTEHLGHGLGVADLVPLWPVTDLRAQDPAAWKRRLLRTALGAGEPFREADWAELAARPPGPRWPLGLGGVALEAAGVVIVSGPPSSAKSVLAVASSVAAARAGWDVLYLSAEMPEEIIGRRIREHCAGPPPPSFRLVDVSYGATIDTLMDFSEARISAQPTLIVFDSISSFVDQAELHNEEDLFGMGPLRRIVMWAINARRASEGQIAYLLLSEINREGRVKGRMADHRADLALAMVTHEQHDILKTIRVSKGWCAPIGPLGDFALNLETWRLHKI